MPCLYASMPLPLYAVWCVCASASALRGTMRLCYAPASLSVKVSVRSTLIQTGLLASGICPGLLPVTQDGNLYNCIMRRCVPCIGFRVFMRATALAPQVCEQRGAEFEGRVADGGHHRRELLGHCELGALGVARRWGSWRSCPRAAGSCPRAARSRPSVTSATAPSAPIAAVAAITGQLPKLNPPMAGR